MSVRSNQSVTTIFPTSVFGTGALANADSLPVGTLYVNGASNAATVTVTNISTGKYSAQVTLPTLAVGDWVAIWIAATVSSVSAGGKVWENTKDVFAGAIPDVVAGGSGGLFISGTNSGTTTLGALTVSGATTLAAVGCTTLTASGAVAFQSTFAVTGTTTLTGAVSLGSTLGVTGTTTLAALNTGAIGTGNVTVTGTVNTTGLVTLAALTVTGATTHTGTTTYTGIWTASNASNNIVGVTATVGGLVTANVTQVAGVPVQTGIVDANVVSLDTGPIIDISTAVVTYDIGNGRTVAYFLQGGTNKIAFASNGLSYIVYGTDDTTPLQAGVSTRFATSVGGLATVDPT